MVLTLIEQYRRFGVYEGALVYERKGILGDKIGRVVRIRDDIGFNSIVEVEWNNSDNNETIWAKDLVLA